MPYSHARNAMEIPFEISLEVPQRIIIFDQIDLGWVRSRVRENPLVTLKELAELVHQQFGVKPSLSHMERIFQLAGISRIPGSRAKQVVA